MGVFGSNQCSRTGGSLCWQLSENQPVEYQSSVCWCPPLFQSSKIRGIHLAIADSGIRRSRARQHEKPTRPPSIPHMDCRAYRGKTFHYTKKKAIFTDFSTINSAA
ncbi:uncharacterized protein Bfra_004435 [Botrytis fragariae]|uniref:Uncharacterized protein n=1 Tax=Botrytis fragariae TaxID=1964551 RepID=A0A8H6EJD3_9HELO|nr:uncharacterized protein Bfra_004435 [Botrytis fragariae]KAF5874428.1 hypothetical protein Bfra_004435 [Botrytis fragariae]